MVEDCPKLVLLEKNTSRRNTTAFFSHSISSSVFLTTSWLTCLTQRPKQPVCCSSGTLFFTQTCLFFSVLLRYLVQFLFSHGCKLNLESIIAQEFFPASAHSFPPVTVFQALLRSPPRENARVFGLKPFQETFVNIYHVVFVARKVTLGQKNLTKMVKAWGRD